MIKIAFFDMDGTLCLPSYKTDKGEVIGFDLDGWIAFCKEKKVHIYDNCKPLPKVGNYAKELKDAGARLYVLTAVMTEEELLSKKKYTKENFPGLFEEVIGVGSVGEKIPEIERIANESGVGLNECELVEDTYDILLEANLLGIKCTHVASFLT